MTLEENGEGGISLLTDQVRPLSVHCTDQGLLHGVFMPMTDPIQA